MKATIVEAATASEPHGMAVMMLGHLPSRSAESAELQPMPSWWCRLFMASALTLVLTGGAAAQGFRIEDPLPDELRERVAELLRLQRPFDTEAALAATKIRDGHLWRESHLLFLRIETDCMHDFCMVIVGRVSDRAIIPELMLSAGPKVSTSDEVAHLWGASGPIDFEGRNGSGLRAWWGPIGWIVEACPNCFVPSEARPKPPPLPPPKKIPEETFEQFRRNLGLEP